MQIPIEISYHNVDASQWIEDYVRERAEHLDHSSGGLIACRVMIEKTQHQHQTGNPFRVRVEATLPPKKILIGDKADVVEDPHIQLRPIIRHAFDAAEKQAKKQRQILRGEVKTHQAPETQSEPIPLSEPVGTVVRLFREEGYGFLKIPSDNEEYYFHRNAVSHGDFKRLETGTAVRFEPSVGEEGPMASTVQIIDKAGKRTSTPNDSSAEPPVSWKRQGKA